MGVRTRHVLVAATLLLMETMVGQSVEARNPDGTWREFQISGSEPFARKHHVMVFDPDANRMIIHGGENATVQTGPFDDIWALDLNGPPTWVELKPLADAATNLSPDARHGHTGIFVPNPSRLVIWGGRNNNPNYAASFLGDTWSLDLESDPPQWTRISANMPTGNSFGCTGAKGPYRPRTHSAAVYFDDKLFISCGITATTFPMSDTWARPVTPGTLWGYKSGDTGLVGSTRCPLDAIPTRRYWHSLIVDQTYDRMITFGGEYDESEFIFSNAWMTSDGVTWSHIGMSPDPYRRKFHTAVYDPIGFRMIVLGGYLPASTNIQDATTALPLPASIPTVPQNVYNNTWVTLDNGDDPGPIAEHAAVYDGNSDRMLVFGGVMTAAGQLRDNDVWALEFDDTPPAAATLTGFVGKTTAVITWNAPGDDGSSGMATSYDLRRSLSPITAGNFEAALMVEYPCTPLSPGSEECASNFGLTACQTYYYALKTFDEVGNWSLSNSLSLQQNCTGTEITCPDECPGGGLLTIQAGLGLTLETPNPAHGRSKLAYELSSDQVGEAVEVNVYDLAGRRIRSLKAGQAEPGSQSVSWDHVGDDGRRVPAGLYFVQLRVGSRSTSQRIIVAR